MTGHSMGVVRASGALVLAALTVITSGACTVSPRETGRISRLERLELHRSACSGPCPEYTVTVEASGHITFVGRRYTAASRGDGTLSPVQINALVAALNEAGFLGLKDQYATEADGCESVATGWPTVTTSVLADGRAKSVRDYHGCLADPQRQVTSQKLPPDPPAPWTNPPPPEQCPQ